MRSNLGGWPTLAYRRSSLRRRHEPSPRGSHDGGSGGAGFLIPPPKPHPGATIPKGAPRPGFNPGGWFPWSPGPPATYQPYPPPIYNPQGKWNGTRWVPHPTTPPIPGFPGGPITAAGAAAALGRLGMRFIPWVGWALLLWGLFEFWQRLMNSNWGMRKAGYTETIDCNRNPNSGFRNGTFSGCAGILAMGSVVSPLFPPYPNFLHKFQVSTATTGRPAIRWDKTITRTDRHIPMPGPRMWPKPAPAPFWPTIDPEAPPSVSPQPQPQPLPPAYTPLQPDFQPYSPNRVRDEPDWRVFPDRPIEFPWPAPEWPQFPQPAPQQPNPPVTVAPVPQPQPSPEPAPEPLPPSGPPGISFNPTGRPDRNGKRPPRRVRPRNKPHSPPRKTKERKLIMSPHARSLLGIALNLATESLDVLDAIWWALPPQYRSPPVWNEAAGYWQKAPALERAQDLWDNFEHVDWDKAMRNLAVNQIGDFIGGQVGRQTARANRAMWDAGYSSPGFSLARGPAM